MPYPYNSNPLIKVYHVTTYNRVKERLSNYLDVPHLINQINAEDVNLGKLNLQDIAGLERHFWKQLRLFPQMSYIYVGTPDDVFSGAEQVPN